MSSQLRIIVNTKGDLQENNISFAPSMVFIKEKANIIYFPPTVKLDTSLVRKAVPTVSQPLSVFTNNTNFTMFMRYATNRRRFTPISLQQAKDDGTIENNFEFFKNIFFKRNNRIFFNGRAYNIISSKINMDKSIIPTDKNNLQFTMNVSLRIIERKNDTFANRTRMSCKDRRESINQQWMLFFGQPFFDEEAYKASKMSQKAPVLYSSDDTGVAEGRAPSKYKSVTKFVPTGALPPYVQPGMINPYQPQVNTQGIMPRASNPYFPVQQPQLIRQNSAPTGGSKTKKRRKKKIRGTRRAKHY